MIIPNGITAIVGGGGKTSLQNWLAAQLSAERKVIITTSTHIWPPDCATLIDPTPAQIRAALAAHSLLAVGTLTPSGKLAGVDALWEELPALCDCVLVEADGSKGRPLKAPAAHEPVLPQGTRLVIAVAGMDGIGLPIALAAHRPELYASIVNKDISAEVTCEDAAKVLMSAQGQFKNVSCRYMAVLNKADTPLRLQYARKIAALLPAETYITAFNSAEPIIEHKEAMP